MNWLMCRLLNHLLDARGHQCLRCDSPVLSGERMISAE